MLILHVFAAHGPRSASHAAKFMYFCVRIIALLRDTANNAIPASIMRLSCPSCQTEYEVPDAALTGRTRRLRCAHCGNQWQYSPPQEQPARSIFSDPMPLPEPPAPEPTPEPLPPEPAPVLTAERRPGPVSFVPEPTPAITTKRRIPIPGMLEDPPKERYSTDSTGALAYGTRSYAQAEELPAPRAAKKGASPWLISILVLLLAAGIIWIERGHIMQAWPPSARLFNGITGLFQHK